MIRQTQILLGLMGANVEVFGSINIYNDTGLVCRRELFLSCTKFLTHSDCGMGIVRLWQYHHLWQ
jgi:hypothetical protein